MHVDGASGGFVAPFIDPDLVWDFRLPRVQSINASGHKYGLVYPGVGWVIWRDPDALPDDLVFNVNYLGGNMPTFALNFSRPGNQVAAQYYNFIRLGFEGYRAVQQKCRDVARYTSEAIAKIGPFQLLTDGSELPVFAFALKDTSVPYTVFDVSERLRDRGWLVPAYTFPENRQDLAALRVVIKNGFSRDLADLLVGDLQRHVAYLEKLPARLPAEGARRGLPPLPVARRAAQTTIRIDGGSCDLLLAVNPVPWARARWRSRSAFHIILVPLGVSWAFMALDRQLPRDQEGRRRRAAARAAVVEVHGGDVRGRRGHRHGAHVRVRAAVAERSWAGSAPRSASRSRSRACSSSPRRSSSRSTSTAGSG